MTMIETNSSEETIKLGERFSKILKEKDIVLLEGVLGGGKTTFVKGVLGKLGLKRKILSPSFTILRQYLTRNYYIYHIDLYRLDKRDIFNLGLEDYLYAPKSITFIEWGEKIEKSLPSYIKVRFSFLGEYARQIFFSSKGQERNIDMNIHSRRINSKKQ
jgi:tRNA threonylcarbamoyladenosine biosynthesis protein TsaE